MCSALDPLGFGGVEELRVKALHGLWVGAGNGGAMVSFFLKALS